MKSVSEVLNRILNSSLLIEFDQALTNDAMVTSTNTSEPNKREAVKMHADMILLAERLVVAMEKMSHDVSNISAYVYDLSCCVSHILNDKRRNASDPVIPCREGDTHPSGACASGEQASVEREYSWPDNQTGVNSASHSDVLEPEESSVGEAASTDIGHNENTEVLSSFNESIKIEKEEDRPSCGMHNSFDNSRSNMRGSSKSESHPPHLECSGASYDMQIASSSSQSPSGMNPQEDSMQNSSECETALFQSLLHQKPFAVASCSTADDSMGQDEDPNMYLAEELGEEQVAEMRQYQHAEDFLGKRCTSYDVTHLRRETQGSALPGSCSVGSEREGRRGGFECPICKKILTTKSTLIVHMRVHTGERPFKCSLCVKAFYQSGDLVRHMRVHTGERPYKCSLCEKSFRECGQLTVHLRIHTGETPFKCDQCGKEFKQSGSLTSHKRTHTG